MTDSGGREHVRDLLEGLKNGLSERFKEVHLDCLADAGVDDAESLRAATFETLAKAGLPLVKAQLILDVTSSGFSSYPSWLGFLMVIAAFVICCVSNWIIFKVQGWQKKSVRQLALASACYLCGRPGDNAPSQCGVFVTPQKVLSTAHGLPANSRVGTQIVAYISGKRDSEELVRVTLKVIGMDKNVDWAVLACPCKRPFLKPAIRNWSELREMGLSVCSFMISLAEQAPEAFSPQFTAYPVLSKNCNHLVYTSSYAAPGDSGGALLMEDGKLVGIHVEGINNLKERYRRKKDVEDRLTAVEQSIDTAIKIVSQGSVALLAKSFPDV